MDMSLDYLALYCKEQEIESLKKARSRGKDQYDYWSGKAEAFSNVWEHIVFGGSSPHPIEYNRANEEWSKRVDE